VRGTCGFLLFHNGCIERENKGNTKKVGEKR
jgi:hypothetical protein